MRLLERLLNREFPGRDALRLQLSSVAGRKIDKNGTLELRSSRTNRADIALGCPTEGTCPDIDGRRIAALLHVKDGHLHRLEIFKEDRSQILRAPTPEDLAVY
jgi:hypothetical protein